MLHRKLIAGRRRDDTLTVRARAALNNTCTISAHAHIDLAHPLIISSLSPGQARRPASLLSIVLATGKATRDGALGQSVRSPRGDSNSQHRRGNTPSVASSPLQVRVPLQLQGTVHDQLERTDTVLDTWRE